MKHYDKNKELLYLKYWNVNNLYGWTMSQNLSLNDFKWVKDISEFKEDFIKSYNDEIQYPENLDSLHNDLPFFLKK